MLINPLLLYLLRFGFFLYGFPYGFTHTCLTRVPVDSHLGKVLVWWKLARYPENRRSARPVEAPTSRFDSRGCPVHRHPRPRAEEAGRISSTRLLQLADVERLPRAKNEIWYQGSETPRSGRRVTRVVSQAA